MDNKKSQTPHNDHDNHGTWVILIGLLFVAYRLEPKVMRLWHAFLKNHRLILWLKIGGGFAVLLILYLLGRKVWMAYVRRCEEKAILGKDKGAVYCGVTLEGESVFIKAAQRRMHTQVIGTTNAGKTESVILPWAIQDMAEGRGLILIDGKADRSLLDKLYAYAVHCKREDDFRLFSLSHLEESTAFNPLLGGTPEEISERVINSFEFENPHYRAVQFEVFSNILRILILRNKPISFLWVYHLLKNPKHLLYLAKETKDTFLISWATEFCGLPSKDRQEQTSGLSAAMSPFVMGQARRLFNAECGGIDLSEAMSKNQIVYFQLPAMKSPFLGKATGKLVLQCFQSAIAERHAHRGDLNFFSCFLDDFTEYLYPGFVTILNKSRSANVGIVFAHQALGDIKTLGDAVSNSILTNANIKVFMRGNDPESAEYFSKVLGTQKAVKFTEREQRGFLSRNKTGDASSREVEEFIVHPNLFKQQLGVGKAIMLVPHTKGSKTVHITFHKLKDLPSIELPKIPAVALKPIDLPPKIQMEADLVQLNQPSKEENE